VGVKSPGSISRRDFIRSSVTAGAAAALGHAAGSAHATARGRVIILGFDGAERTIVEKMLDKGELPNLAALRAQGMYSKIRTSIPPQSPVAWASFATCTNPGNHGLFDFLNRDPKRYTPGMGFGRTDHARLANDGSLLSAARGVNFRRGDTFWASADRQGARCKILTMPFSYPPDDLRYGQMLCGDGVMDIRTTQSTFFSLSDAFTPEQLKERVSGGVRLPIAFNGDRATVEIPGIPDLVDRRSRKYVKVPVELIVDRGARTLTVSVQRKMQTVAENAWSDWFEWTFPVSPAFSVRAISRFHVLEAGEHVRLYMTCLQFHPKEPYTPFTSPPSYAAELADRYGLYKTIGWRYDTHALRQDAFPEDVFLDDLHNTMAWQETLTLDELERGDFDLLVSMWTATDRVAHLFWRFRDPKHPLYTAEGAAKYGRAIENAYTRMDQTVGKVMAKLSDNDLLVVLSDHGFHSSRVGFNVNTWLVRNGYLAVQGQPDPESAFTEKRFLELGGPSPYDWSRTRLYGLGLGSVYLNLEGRERDGIVSADEAPALLDEVKQKLLALTDPATGEKVFSGVYTREVFQGRAAADAPDIELGYADGYQTTKKSAAGAAPAQVFEPNDDKWSAEHAASDPAITPGVLFANRALSGPAALTDIGITALTYLGLEVPDNLEGRCLL